jgi:hypothetical protein
VQVPKSSQVQEFVSWQVQFPKVTHVVGVNVLHIPKSAHGSQFSTHGQVPVNVQSL